MHVLREINPLKIVLKQLLTRECIGLAYSPELQNFSLIESSVHSGWLQKKFVLHYSPRTRIIIQGDPTEVHRLAELAISAGCDVIVIDQVNPAYSLSIDRFTAVVLLKHDLDAEEKLLNCVLMTEAFYVGALGGKSTQYKRIERLKAHGWSDDRIEQIHAPIGLFGPTRDARSLAVSVLADIFSTRQAL